MTAGLVTAPPAGLLIAPPAGLRPSETCPYLGLVDDAATAALYARPDHRCYRARRPSVVAGEHQRTYCLSAEHAACPVFTGVAGSPPVAFRERWQFDRRSIVAGLVFVVVIPALLATAVALLTGDDGESGGPGVSRPGGAAAGGAVAVGTAGGIAHEPPGEGAVDAGAGGAGAGDAGAVDGEAGGEATGESTGVAPPAGDPVAQLRAWPNVVTWVVKPGDSLLAIAREFGTTVEAVAVYNGLSDWAAIFAEQALKVPVGFREPLGLDADRDGVRDDAGGGGEGASGGGETEPGAGGSAGGAAGGAADEGADTGSPGAPPLAPDEPSLDAAALAELEAWPTLLDYVVEEGDSLFTISLEFGTTVDAIALRNNLADVTAIQPGQALVIPLGFDRPLHTE